MWKVLDNKIQYINGAKATYVIGDSQGYMLVNVETLAEAHYLVARLNEYLSTEDLSTERQKFVEETFMNMIKSFSEKYKSDNYNKLRQAVSYLRKTLTDILKSDGDKDNLAAHALNNTTEIAMTLDCYCKEHE